MFNLDEYILPLHSLIQPLNTFLYVNQRELATLFITLFINFLSKGIPTFGA